MNCVYSNQQVRLFSKKSKDIVMDSTSNKQQNAEKFDPSSLWYKLLIPVAVGAIYWYIKRWENDKARKDFGHLRSYLEKYQDQITEQAFNAGVESLMHEEHRDIMYEIIGHSSETGKYLVESSLASIPLFEMNIRKMENVKLLRPHPTVDGYVKYALFGELWTLAEQESSTKLKASGKKCLDSRDITLNLHFPIKVLPKTKNGSVLGHLEDKPLVYLSLNVRMKAIDRDFSVEHRPELVISRISISPITTYFPTIQGLREQRVFDEIEIEKAIAPNGIHHASDGLHNITFQFNFYE
ncbi:hypothetical protein C9374_003684 [Naegleria lovaniensis]|uniref:Uncharacterized protein n=1 Tax=Naegleria lovaniensis TaxID=51637 RepID=A0AA88GZP7_NAELO|nr:uncharacterized protein C9374_003684 [Naegleria lovaniensis]KAG2393920.1 hypothetical protein C9374_003684 [Naegleria lovaniensis]